MPIANTDFDYIRNLVRERSAIVLEDDKRYLVEARLNPLLKKNEFSSAAELVAKLKAPGAAKLIEQVVELMTTNETTFFRDTRPFEMLRDELIPGLIQSRSAERSLRIWSAASSTGQEAYTISMVLREHFPQLADWRIEIVGTDLSNEVLGKAREGKYSQLEVNRGLPAKLLVKYFKKIGNEWQIDASLRRMVEFKQFNLIGRWPLGAPYDIIFLRNVLIYFDVDIKRRILDNIKRSMRSDGFLFLGAAETTINVDAELVRTPGERTGCFQLATKSTVVEPSVARRNPVGAQTICMGGVS